MNNIEISSDDLMHLFPGLFSLMENKIHFKFVDENISQGIFYCAALNFTDYKILSVDETIDSPLGQNPNIIFVITVSGRVFGDFYLGVDTLFPNDTLFRLIDYGLDLKYFDSSVKKITYYDKVALNRDCTIENIINNG